MYSEIVEEKLVEVSAWQINCCGKSRNPDILTAQARRVNRNIIAIAICPLKLFW